MFWKKKESNSIEVDWQLLTSTNQLDQIKEESKTQPVMIYKHSTRCGISSMAMDRLERSWDEEAQKIKAYYLDLIRYREVSNQVAETFKVYHQSPQVILVKDGDAVYDDSHMSISVEALKSNA